MKHILTWLAILALVAAAMSVDLPLLKNKVVGDLKTASSFIGPFGYGYGWGYPYFGWGYPYFGKGFGGWGYPYWG